MDVAFSIIMPCFNAGEYLAEAVESALNQMKKGDELLIQDACSTDGSLEKLQKYALADDRVFLVSERDTGQSQALNKALRRATKEYVLWLNADDILREDSLAAIRMGASAGSGVIYGGHQVIRASGEVIATYFPNRVSHNRLISRGCYIFSGSIAVRRETLLAIGGFDESLHFCMDSDLIHKLMGYPGISFQRIEVVVGALRWHEASKSGTSGRKFISEGLKVQFKYSQGFFDLCRVYVGVLIKAVAIFTTPLRHTEIYQRLRRRRRERPVNPL